MDEPGGTPGCFQIGLRLETPEVIENPAFPFRTDRVFGFTLKQILKE